MTESVQVKVYELAKELGIDSISLLDRLKDLNIRVKNHMSELKAEEAQIARSALKKPADAPAKKAAGATRVRKKAAEPAAAESQVPAGASTKPLRRAAAPAQAAAPAADAQAADASKINSPVLRRRIKADGTAETTQAIPGVGAVPLKSHAEHAEEMAAAAAAAQSEEFAVEGEISQEQVSSFTQEPGTETETVEATEAQVQSGEVASTDAPVKTVYTFNRPVAPRKTFLKIVEAQAPPPRPMIKPATPAGGGITAKPGLKGQTTSQDKDGFRIIKMTKENLDQMVEEEAAKKRGLGTREVSVRPEDVRFADYRKKELVFLPKKKKLPIGKEVHRTQVTTPSAQKRVIEMQDTITVQNLASAMSIKAGEVIRKLMGMGQMATINQSIDFDTATLLAQEYHYEVRNVAFKEEEILSATVEDATETLLPRPPVVTIMGHVDHGKTTLLDAIREADVAGGEAGGITQHIGAYTVEKNGKQITFIDTPGHEAFTVMRARGANVTDIVILVVSADDGVMPQTREALSHAQAAKVPIIVAVNKIDKPGANPEKIKQALAELNLLAEDWGGETQFVQVSALKKTNIEGLLDAILLQTEILDLKANPNRLAQGTVLEARLERGRGAVVSLLITRGTLRVGDPIVASQFYGKVKALMDDKGRAVKEATPGTAVEVLGFEGIPNAGEPFSAVADESTAHKIAESRIEKLREKNSAPAAKVSLEDFFSKMKSGEAKELGVILKADVFGSVEAIRDSLLKLSTDKVKVKILMATPGGITESDVLLATASHAIILGFNVRPETKARQLAEAEHIEIRSYTIIYELLDDVKSAMLGLLDKRKVEKFLGRAEVRQTFTVPKIGTIAGSAVIDGKIIRGANVRLLRDSRVIFDGKMHSLRRFKDDAKEVAQGYECGIGLENYNDLKPGDIIEAYQIDLVTPEMSELG